MLDKNKIIVGEKIFDASPYQASIFNEIERGSGNMVITAAAGSAKTTTIENCLRFIAEGKKSLFLAFNVSTVEKLSSEVEKSLKTQIMTFHGLGNRVLRENGIITEATLTDEFKYSRFVKQNIESLSSYGGTNELGAQSIAYISNIISLIDYARYYMAMRVNEIAEVADIYGIVPIRDEYEVVRKALIWGKENIGEIDYTDMIWLPNVMNLVTKKYLFDFIFIDEAQDTTLAHQQLVDKCFKRGCRFIAVGDPRQQINVWCGATEKAIENYSSRPNTKQMKLPISYRCPYKIIELAKRYAPDIMAADFAKEGAINYDVSPNDARPGDMVLCRIMSKLIEQYLIYLRNNKKAFLKGSDGVKSTYLALINSVHAEKIDVNCLTTNGLIPQLYKILFKRMEDIEQQLKIDEAEVLYHYEILNLYDNIVALKVLSEGLETVNELIDKINVIFNGNEEDAIILSTVHKAKGMEADNIFILCPSLMPSQLARKGWELQAEKNLLYVAITRAKKTLNFIKEDEKGFYKNFQSTTSMKTVLSKIREKINYISEVRENRRSAIAVPSASTESIKVLGVKTEEEPRKKKKKFLNLD